MDILSTLFGGKDRVRIIRYALAHTNEAYDIKTVAQDLGIDTISARRELKVLASVGFIEEQNYTKKIVKKTRQGDKIVKERTVGYGLVETFPYLESFQKMFLAGGELSGEELLEHFKKLGTINLFLVSGVFLQETLSDVDLLLVGQNLKRNKIEQQITELEKFLGFELRYAIFDTEEFIYRRLMHDRFIEEVFHHPHTIIVNTID